MNMDTTQTKNPTLRRMSRGQLQENIVAPRQINSVLLTFSFFSFLKVALAEHTRVTMVTMYVTSVQATPIHPCHVIDVTVTVDTTGLWMILKIARAHVRERYSIHGTTFMSRDKWAIRSERNRPNPLRNYVFPFQTTCHSLEKMILCLRYIHIHISPHAQRWTKKWYSREWHVAWNGKTFSRSGLGLSRIRKILLMVTNFTNCKIISIFTPSATKLSSKLESHCESSSGCHSDMVTTNQHWRTWWCHVWRHMQAMHQRHLWYTVQWRIILASQSKSFLDTRDHYRSSITIVVSCYYFGKEWCQWCRGCQLQ